MFPRRPPQIFRSRWSALFWAAGVVWTAVTIVGVDTHARPKPEPSPTVDAWGQPVNSADLAVLANAAGH